MFACICALYSLFSIVSSGPVNSPNSFPYSAINKDADTLTSGNIKIHNISSEHDVFTGGILARDESNLQKVISLSCSAIETKVFTSFMGKLSWVQVPNGKFSGRRVCGLTSTGLIGQLFMDTNTLLITNFTSSESYSLYIPLLSEPTFLVPVGTRFFVFSRSVSLYIETRGISHDLTYQFIISPFLFLHSRTRFASNQNFVLKADSDGVYLAKISDDIKSPVQSPISLKISPCSDVEACAVSLSPVDDSWVVSGYWGAYWGSAIGGQTQRLLLPLSGKTNAAYGTSISHQKIGGVFVYLGTDDGDFGHLPVPLPDSSVKSPGWVIWKRAGGAGFQSLVENFLFTVPRVYTKKDSVSLERHLDIVYIKEDLPSEIPPSWVHWEQNVAINTLNFKTGIAKDSESWISNVLGIQEAFDLVKSKNITPKNVPVAIIDSGVGKNSRLKQEIFNINNLEVPNNLVDDDKNGWVDDIIGYDFVKETGDPLDKFGHGTMCTGLLAGRNEPYISAGANVKLKMVRALDASGHSNSIDLLRSIKYVLKSDTRVLSCSWGGGSDTQALRDGFELLNKSNITVFSSAGNDGSNTDVSGPEVPKIYKGVIAVGASDVHDARPSYSNYGKSTVKFFAPGDKVQSTDMAGSISTGSGTSFAAPVIAGVFAYVLGVILAKRPFLTWPDAQKYTLDILCKTSIQKPKLTSVCGRISLSRAVKLALED